MNINAASLAVVLIPLSATCAGVKPSFVIADRIYAVPGVECRISYGRVFDSYTPWNYLLEAHSGYGMADATEWTFTPGEEMAGKSFPVVLNAWSDEHGLIASATTQVMVASRPTNVQKSRKITLALLAASDTNCLYQDRIRERMLEAGFSAYTPVGSHTGGSSSPVCDPASGAPHDGYGGFSWEAFLTRYSMTVDEIDNVHAQAEKEQLRSFGVKLESGNKWRKVLLKSPLVKIRNGEKVVDIQAWFDKINGGKTPDYTLIKLGGNNVWEMRHDYRTYRIDRELENARKLVGLLRRAAPDMTIVLVSFMGGSFDQHGWARNYDSKQNCFIAHCNFLEYNRRIMALCETSGDPKLKYAQVSQGLSLKGVYPEGETANALHPTLEGGKQLGDAIFAWLVNDIVSGK